MLNDQKFAVLSLELHLFYTRIMKEHALFLEAGFTPKNANMAKEADKFKTQFESLLQNAVTLSNGIIGNDVLESGEIVTDYTMGAEQKTQNFTGILINQKITTQESRLYSAANAYITPKIVDSVRDLNNKVMTALNKFIDFKTRILDEMLSCTLFTVNYPMLIKHILSEARLYHQLLSGLQQNLDIEYGNMKQTQLFWDEIMMEHALFIRGLLDPSEPALISAANDFADDFAGIMERTKQTSESMLSDITESTLQEVIKIRNFKQAGTIGISECKIRSIILPLLADHVLREANHYIRLLKNNVTQ